MFPSSFALLPHIRQALQGGGAVVALESTVITHGLPYPDNLQLAREMEDEVRQHAALPATIAVLDGRVRVGLEDADLERLVSTPQPRKISRRDLAAAIVQKATGGTTVAGTMHIAHRVGIRVFATGGIGGVHRESPFDVSADLHALADTPMVVVCAGAKAILDLPATLEVLETLSVPVVGYRTDEFPAFYSRESGLGVSARLDAPEEVAAFARAHWGAGARSAVLVVNPVPVAESIPRSEIEPLIVQASRQAQEAGIHGQALTPFLLQRLNELSGGRSLRANLSLLRNNARLAAQVARALATGKRLRDV
ncbi:MAG: pseudouridine-5'-phosphate glycosidase [Anaerolineae bacterium]|nr:MAG: pseudouridine-5'-phosphate glycosidase [Anaerolineae bacterium]